MRALHRLFACTVGDKPALRQQKVESRYQSVAVSQYLSISVSQYLRM